MKCKLKGRVTKNAPFATHSSKSNLWLDKVLEYRLPVPLNLVSDNFGIKCSEALTIKLKKYAKFPENSKNIPTAIQPASNGT